MYNAIGRLKELMNGRIVSLYTCRFSDAVVWIWPNYDGNTTDVQRTMWKVVH